MAKQEFVATLEKASPAKLKPVKGKTLNLRPLVGRWRNCDKQTRGLVRVDLSSRNGVLRVHPFGACTPTPCDWGTVRGQAYTESVVSRDAVAFTSRFKTSFSVTTVTGHLCDGCLVVETFTRFTDKSGRCPYYSRLLLPEVARSSGVRSENHTGEPASWWTRHETDPPDCPDPTASHARVTVAASIHLAGQAAPTPSIRVRIEPTMASGRVLR